MYRVWDSGLYHDEAISLLGWRAFSHPDYMFKIIVDRELSFITLYAIAGEQLHAPVSSIGAFAYCSIKEK